MRGFIVIVVLLGTFAPSNTLFAQKNRISIQTGLFHEFFEDTPIFNKEAVSKNPYWKIPLYYFGGHFNDSWGFQFRRTLNPKSSLSCEYMIYSGVYQPLSENWTGGGPRLLGKRFHKVNVTYSRNLKMGNKWQFNYGAGVSTQWGIEKYFLISGQHSGGFWEPHYQNYYRHDLGVNVRSGVEYSPISQLTLFSYIDFLGTLFLSYPSDGNEELYPDFFAEHGDEINASRIDLSLNFGIGFNF